MIETCPVCGGNLYIEEERAGRRFARARRVVRCDGCRSILRQRGRSHWHYAVDPQPKPAFYRRVNGQTFTEAELVVLLEEAQIGPEPAEPEPLEQGSEADDLPAEEVATEAAPAPAPAPEPEESAEPEDDGLDTPRFVADDDLGDDW